MFKYHTYACNDPNMCVCARVCFTFSPFLDPRGKKKKKAGELLASRIYGKATEEMDYSLVATAVFTPVSLLTIFLLLLLLPLLLLSSPRHARVPNPVIT